MNEKIDKILKRLENFSDLNQREKKSMHIDLIEFSEKQPDKFIELVREIQPSEESVLHEIYEILSAHPDKWIDFIISEFDRIEKCTILSKNKLKDSIASPLISLSFFTRQEFTRNEKLISRIKKGVSSDSKQIVKISMDLLADTYLIDKSKYSSCRQVIEKQINSQTTEIARNAKKIIDNFNNPAELKKKLRWYSAYSFLVFLIGLILNVLSLLYYNKTFINFSVIAMTFLFIGFITWFIHQIVTKNKSVKKSETVSVVLGYGFIACFLLLFINFQSPDNNIQHENCEIIDHGTLARGKYSDCRQPYVKFERKGIIKKMTFECDDQELVENAKMIEFKIKKGLFGFDIVTDKALKTTGANRSVYVIGFPHRENFLAKEDC